MSPKQAETLFWANSFILLVGEVCRDFFIFALSLAGLVCFNFWGFSLSAAFVIFSEILSINKLKRMVNFNFEEAEGREAPEPPESSLPGLCTNVALAFLFTSFLVVYL
nr:MAG TPA: hypothetical protein [Caudoviricetes sp.]